MSEQKKSRFPPVKFNEKKLLALGFTKKEHFDRESNEFDYDNLRFVDYERVIDEEAEFIIAIDMSYEKKTENGRWIHTETAKSMYFGAHVYLHNVNSIGALKKLIETLEGAMGKEPRPIMGTVDFEFAKNTTHTFHIQGWSNDAKTVVHGVYSDGEKCSYHISLFKDFDAGKVDAVHKKNYGDKLI